MSIIYDGECPFCRSYVSLMKLRDAVGDVELVDARARGPIVDALARQGYDLNEGMVVVYGDTVYHGKDAVVLISSMTGQQPWAGQFLATLLRNKARARIFYPIMKFGRRMTLKMLGIREL